MGKKRVFITGCAGFIGFHLASGLKKRGDEVLGYDNFNDYYSVNLKEDRAETLENEGVKIIRGDICDKPALQKIIAEFKPTHFVHLAAQAGVRYSLINPQAYVRSNLEGFTNVLEVVRESPALRLIYASSSSVYGLNKKIPYSVKDPTDAQASFYGATKKSNELMAKVYEHLYGMQTIGLRFFTVYGPWGRPDMALYSFTEAILKGETIDIFNYGEMSRDFTYIDDIIDGTIASIDYDGPSGIFNLGNHKPVTLLKFVQTLEEALGKKAATRLLPMQPGDIPVTYADITESQESLRFNPKTELNEGIKKFTDWYLEYRRNNFAKGGT